MDKKTYKKYVAARAPRSLVAKNSLRAFVCGGAICAAAQGLKDLFLATLGLSDADAGTLTSVTLVFLSALLTGLGVFDKVAKLAGAGTLVPITGFANAVASPAIDSKSEGYILGVGAKIFTVAGPVLLYGIFSGAVYGALYWLVSLFA